MPPKPPPQRNNRAAAGQPASATPPAANPRLSSLSRSTPGGTPVRAPSPLATTDASTASGTTTTTAPRAGFAPKQVARRSREERERTAPVGTKQTTPTPGTTPAVTAGSTRGGARGGARGRGNDRGGRGGARGGRGGGRGGRFEPIQTQAVGVFSGREAMPTDSRGGRGRFSPAVPGFGLDDNGAAAAAAASRYISASPGLYKSEGERLKTEEEDDEDEDAQDPNAFNMTRSLGIDIDEYFPIRPMRDGERASANSGADKEAGVVRFDAQEFDVDDTVVEIPEENDEDDEIEEQPRVDAAGDTVMGGTEGSDAEAAVIAAIDPTIKQERGAGGLRGVLANKQRQQLDKLSRGGTPSGVGSRRTPQLSRSATPFIPAAKATAYISPEEMIELKRVSRDHRAIIDEFEIRAGQPPAAPASTASDSSGVDSKESSVSILEDGAERTKRPEIEHKLYFFQMPLVAPTFGLEPAEAERQAAARRAAATVDVDMTADDAPGPSTRATATAARGRTAAAPAPAASTPSTPGASSASLDDARRQYPEGRIGALRVHKSGRLTMTMGGVVMEVSQGTLANFLQDVAVFDAAQQRAHLIGQVTRKMVVTPDISSLLP